MPTDFFVSDQVIVIEEQWAPGPAPRNFQVPNPVQSPEKLAQAVVDKVKARIQNIDFTNPPLWI